jgi:GntR family transcriptional repressor for pyruvate dehydrogenase complex
MPLKPVQKILVSDGILDQIREMILSSELSPGQKLPSETSLAKHLSVSRSSLREALNALVHLGYLQRQNRGVYVAPKSQWRTNLSSHFLRSREDEAVAAMIEVRKIVEPELCALAAKRAEADDLKALEESLREMKSQVDDSNAFVNSDHHFHLCIAKAAKNSVLGDFIEKIRDLLRSNISLVIQKSTISRRSLDYHQRIYEALREGNAAQARKVMATHIADIEKEFFKILYRPSESS